ncbi:aconitase family protein, partial [Streptococcus suis]
HTGTHGAFGAIALGIGTSDVEHVLATHTIWPVKPKRLLVEFVGQAQAGVYAKDFILALIARYGVDCGLGQVADFAGPVI